MDVWTIKVGKSLSTGPVYTVYILIRVTCTICHNLKNGSEMRGNDVKVVTKELINGRVNYC